MKKYFNINIGLIVTGGVLTLFILLFYILLMTGVQLPSDDDEFYLLTIPMGASLAQVADSLLSLGITESRREVTTAGRMLGADKLIKAGRYKLKGGSRLYEIFNLITSGDVEPVVVTLLEGWSAKRIAEELSDKLDINKVLFKKYLSDSVYIKSLGLDVPHLEGYLYPDTYHFSFGMSEKSMIQWMVTLFLDKFGETERKRAEELSMTVSEIITLASIIEGEVVQDEERPIVSSVYHNRLNIGMRLQADPTIQYILTDGPRRLSTKDLFIKSPYNTYRQSGLPPGPIGNPGFPSIKAALWPADTDYIYFVATGAGYHTFSTTLEEHNSAKQKLRKLRRDYDKQQLENKK